MKNKNPRKDSIVKNIWFKSEKEYKQLKDALDSGDNDKVLDIIFKVYKRRDL